MSIQNGYDHFNIYSLFHDELDPVDLVYYSHDKPHILSEVQCTPICVTHPRRVAFKLTWDSKSLGNSELRIIRNTAPVSKTSLAALIDPEEPPIEPSIR